MPTHALIFAIVAILALTFGGLVLRDIAGGDEED